MKSSYRWILVAFLAFLFGCQQQQPQQPVSSQTDQFKQAEALAKAGNGACWGQATAVFAQMGLMGQHASQQPTPRVGLRNLARELFELGLIPDDSMQSLGAFVANELGLSIEACM